jgi:hypothetical protein
MQRRQYAELVYLPSCLLGYQLLLGHLQRLPAVLVGLSLFNDFKKNKRMSLPSVFIAASEHLNWSPGGADSLMVALRT